MLFSVLSTVNKIFSSSANFASQAQRAVINEINIALIYTAHLGPPAEVVF
jgi:hypothetical protein